MAAMPAVGIVGCGRVGGAVGLALRSAGYEIAALWSRSRTGRERAQSLLGAPVLPPPDVAAAGELVLVTVPDSAIAAVARRLAPGVRRGSLVVHMSGGTSIEALAPARQAGGRIGCLHPLQTIPDPVRGAEALAGSAVAVTCRPADRAALYRVARAWGGRPFPLADADKPLYHAAAVLASNDVVTAIWAAQRLLALAGVARPLTVLGPLVRATAANVIAEGPAKAITGPVVRGDVETVRRHLAALQARDPTGGRITAVYRELARLTATLAGGDMEALGRATA